MQLHVWDLRGQRQLYQCADSIGDVALSPDGRWLAYQAQVRPRDLTISEFRIVEVQTGEIVGRFICHDPTMPAFSSDGTRLVFQGYGKDGYSYIFTWDVSGRCLLPHDRRQRFHYAISNDSKVLICWEGSRNPDWTLWDLRTNTFLREIPAPEMYAVIALDFPSERGQITAYGSPMGGSPGEYHTFRLDLARSDGRLLWTSTPLPLNASSLYRLTKSDRQVFRFDQLAHVTLDDNPRSQFIRECLHMRQADPAFLLTGHRGTLAVSPDGRYLARIVDDYPLTEAQKLWNRFFWWLYYKNIKHQLPYAGGRVCQVNDLAKDSCKEVRAIPIGRSNFNPSQELLISPDSRKVAVTMYDGKAWRLEVWSISPGRGWIWSIVIGIGAGSVMLWWRRRSRPRAKTLGAN